jgi:deoxycitidine kinase/deoxyguanosine kinase
MSCIITIEGNIGAGKSTFVKFLKETCNDLKLENIIFLQEPVDEWMKITHNNKTILEKFYEDPDKYAFAFQMMAYISRLSILEKAIKENPNSIIISERCLLTDKHVFARMLHDTNKIDSYSYQIYNLWFNHFYNKLPRHKHIYLKSSPDLIKFRINKRNRTGENNIDIEYLTKCNKYHKEYYDKNSNLLLAVDMDKIELFSDNLDDPLNVKYKNLINDIINEIIIIYKSSNLVQYDNFIKRIKFMVLVLFLFLAILIFCLFN